MSFLPGMRQLRVRPHSFHDFPAAVWASHSERNAICFSVIANRLIVMPNTFSSFIVAPVLGWLTLLALVVVSYLVRLEFLERRKNRRIEEKRTELEQRTSLTAKVQRPLAMRKMVQVSAMTSDCPRFGHAFQKFDRHGSLNLRPIDLN